jgi:hypothetical protein
VVARLQLDRLGEKVDGLLKVAGREGGVALRLLLVLFLMLGCV